MARKKAETDFLNKPVLGKDLLPLIHGVDTLQKATQKLELIMDSLLYHIRKKDLQGFEDFDDSFKEYKSYADYVKTLYDAPLTSLAEMLANNPVKGNPNLEIHHEMYDLQEKLKKSGMEIQDVLNYLKTLEPHDPSVQDLAALMKLEAERKARASLLSNGFLEDANGNKYPVKFNTDPTDNFNISNHFLDFTPQTKGMNLQIFMSNVLAGLNRVGWTSPSGNQELHPALPMRMIQINPNADGGVRIILQYTQPSE